jgi:hypothetical protein
LESGLLSVPASRGDYGYCEQEIREQCLGSNVHPTASNYENK